MIYYKFNRRHAFKRHFIVFALVWNMQYACQLNFILFTCLSAFCSWNSQLIEPCVVDYYSFVIIITIWPNGGFEFITHIASVHDIRIYCNCHAIQQTAQTIHMNYHTLFMSIQMVWYPFKHHQNAWWRSVEF